MAMTIARRLVMAHIVALGLLLAGIIYALRHPELWADHALGRRAFDFSMEFGALLAAAIGAATILAFGFATAGPIHTERILLIAFVGSLTVELIGTSNLPWLGNYTYTDFLGSQFFGRVPYAIPLSTFSMGVASYLLARALLLPRHVRHPDLAIPTLSAWIFTAWILCLGPPVAGEDLTVQFWEWRNGVPHFGLALQNCLLWAAASWIVMAGAHRAWAAGADARRVPIRVPFTLYAANLGFAIGLGISIEFVLPIVLGVAGLVPATLALWQGVGRQPGGAGRRRLRPIHAR